MKKMTPIFLISLPRSGSTLLQRMLMLSPNVHSVSEPWLLLPFAYALQEEGMRAIYSHRTALYAIEDFIETLPNGRKDFCKEIEKFVMSLYAKTSHGKGASYFLDKTPRYYLISSFLSEVFPTAKFIFLFRNPLEVQASIMATWYKNKFTIDKHFIDIYKGPRALSDGYALLQDRSIAVNYKNLVYSPEVELQKICSFLQIPFDSAMTKSFNNIKFSGRLGDQNGVKKYDAITMAPLDKWKSILNTHFRVWFIKRYVLHLGNGILKDFGTSVNELTREIDSIPKKSGSLQDLYYYLISNIVRWVNTLHWVNKKDAQRKLKLLVKKERLYPFM